MKRVVCALLMRSRLGLDEQASISGCLRSMVSACAHGYAHTHILCIKLCSNRVHYNVSVVPNIADMLVVVVVVVVRCHP